MKIVDYDSEHCAIIVNKRQLRNAGFSEGEEVYVITIENGLLGILRKSSFKEHLRDAIRKGIESPSSAQTTPLQEFKLSDDEHRFLSKISKVKFSDRTPDKVLALLSEDEHGLLKSLIDKGVIRLYKSAQTGDMVYAINNKVYSQLQSHSVEHDLAKEEVQASQEGAVEDVLQEFLSVLKKDGFVMVPKDEQAKLLSDRLSDYIKKGVYIGMRGYDSRYYVFSKKMYKEAYDKINTVFAGKKSLSLQEISKGTGLSEDVCKGIICFMLENGELIEKSRGKYELVL
ncbi:MAG: hypothetical protein ACP5H8_03380 [Candidatus Micrarchaeia archaeon]